MSNNAINPFQQFLSTAEPSASIAAKLRMLLPIIESRLSAGATYAAVVADLNSAGLEVSIGVFRLTLSRIRTKNRNRHHAVETAPISTTATASVSRTESQQPKRIETPADLRELRAEDIDLDALRQQRRESQRNQRK